MAITRSMIGAIIGVSLGIVLPSFAQADHLTQTNNPESTTKHAPPGQLERERPPIKTGWGVSLRGGGALFTNDIQNSPKNFGWLVNGQIFYHMGGDWNWGLNIDGERHNLQGTSTKFETLSLIPYMEFKKNFDWWSPYVTLGVGVNFNSFRKEPTGMAMTAKNTIAFKGGFGTDIFLTDNLALNLEAAWKLNNASSQNYSVVQGLFGFRWYFNR